MDTKWKLLSEAKANYGISQGDMYQMYAYQNKYDAKTQLFLYPKTELVQTENIEFREIYDDGVIMCIRIVDLFNIQERVPRRNSK